MLFSGLGPDAQNQLGVGVGALAGSTIMLLTVPWGAAVIAGRVGIGPDGLAHYGVKRKKTGAAKPDRQGVLARKMGGASEHVLTSTGVSPAPSIKANAYVMVATSLVYLVIQGPAFPYWTEPSSDDVMAEVSSVERWWALAGLVIALLAFCGYLLLMVQQASSEENLNRIDSAIIKALQSDSPVTLSGVPAWSEWPSWQCHGWPPRAPQPASEGFGAALGTRGERPSVSDTSERPWPSSQRPPKSSTSPRLTIPYRRALPDDRRRAAQDAGADAGARAAAVLGDAARQGPQAARNGAAALLLPSLRPFRCFFPSL